MARIAQVEFDEGLSAACVVPPELGIHQGDQCVVQVGRSLDFGRVTRLEETTDTHEGKGARPQVVRCATLQDRAKASENAVRSKMAADTCMTVAKRLDMNMRLVRVRYAFDRALLTVTFAADKGIETREFARVVEQDLNTRVELQQIGVRDEAGAIGGVGTCGRCLCCCTWLRHFEAVNVKMAKTQGLSLNPGTIGGNCGRLKCCLRYEHALYEELGSNMPRQGARVECPEGSGIVVDRQVLKRRVRVRLEDDRIQAYDVDHVCPRRRARERSGRFHETRTGTQRPQSQSAGSTRTRSVRPDHAG